MACTMTYRQRLPELGPLAVGVFSRNWVVFLFHVECRTKSLPLYRAPLGIPENSVGTSLLIAAKNICILAGALCTNLLQHPIGR
jgi:hypothetical protein